MADADSNYAPRSPDLSPFDHTTFNTDLQSTFPPYSNLNHPQFGQPLPGQPIPTQQQPYQQTYYSEPVQYMAPQNHQSDPDGEWLPEASEDVEHNAGHEAAPNPADEDYVPSADVTRGIEIKTKFPVARIKRIMQADEDVGKVAQVTPVAVSKALELFMIAIVCGAADEAKARSSKRVTAVHLKQAIQKDQRFDFLLEKVDKVPDAPAPAEPDGNGEEGAPKKKKRAGRKKTTDGNES